MKNKALTGAAALLLLAMAAPVNSYHIDGSPTPSGASTGDWTMQTPFLIVCESEGPTDDRNAHATALEGQGGLCTTGRNDASGTAKPLSQPGKDDWTRLDTCDVGTFFLAGDCAARGGTTSDIAFSGRVGAYTCFVPTLTSPPTQVAVSGTTYNVTTDYALYYEEMYAWWSYDGSAPYSPGDAPGAPHSGTGGLLTNNEDAWHGHATMFIDLPNSVGTPTTGSSEAMAVTGMPAPSDLPSQCEGAPSGSGPAPVGRAPYN